MLMHERDIIGLEKWLAHYVQTPQHDKAAARRIRVLLTGIRGFHQGITETLKALYIILQTSHRGEFRITEEKLLEFDLAGSLKSNITMKTDEESGDYMVSVPSDERRVYTDDDDAPFIWPEQATVAGQAMLEEINSQILEDIFPDEPTLPGGKWSL